MTPLIFAWNVVEEGAEMRFLDDLEKYRGCGGRNEAGQTLEEFLEEYDAKKYDCPSNTVDMLIFKKCGEGASSWKLLMIKRRNHPNIGFWALPGGFVELREDLETAARRELEEETGITGLPMIQLHTYGNVDRDPRWRIITTAYLTLIEEDIRAEAGDDAADAAWFEVSEEVRREGDKDLITLKFCQPESGLTMEAGVERTCRSAGLLREYRYKMVSTSGLAIDHGSLIAQAIDYLKSQER